MIKYTKPSGIEIEVANNEVTIDYVESLGWKKVEPKKPEVKPKLKEVKK